jgi:hypothetical protein
MSVASYPAGSSLRSGCSGHSSPPPDGDYAGFHSFLSAGKVSPQGHVPVGLGYVLLDFNGKKIVSYQTAASFESLPRSLLKDIYDSSQEDGAAVARAITHRECMAGGRGKLAVGPFDGSERERICGYANVHERFSTYDFAIPGWKVEQAVLTPEAMRATFDALDGESILSEAERAEWMRCIAAREDRWALFLAAEDSWKKETH